MCILCDRGFPQNHTRSQLGRRDFLKTTAAGGAAAGLGLFAARPAAAQGDDAPEDSGRRGRRYIIRGGHVMSIDPQVGDFASADVLVEGKKILAVGPNLRAGGADEIDARGKIVMPGFIDTHHHQFETALRSFLANGVLINDRSGSASATPSYFEYILLTFAPVYRPEDVYISELFGGLAQLDDGVTTVPSGRCSTRDDEPLSVTSRARAVSPAINIHSTRPASRRNSSPRAISLST